MEQKYSKMKWFNFYTKVRPWIEFCLGIFILAILIVDESYRVEMFGSVLNVLHFLLPLHK